MRYKIVNGLEVPLTPVENQEFEEAEEKHATFLASNEYAVSLNKEKNYDIYKQLNDIDMKSIRALREKNTEVLNELELLAQGLRSQLL